MLKPKLRAVVTFVAIVTGGIAGGLTYSIQYPLARFLLEFDRTTGGQWEPIMWVAGSLLMSLLLSVFVAPYFILGMLVVGWPVWLIMHRIGVRSVWAGALAGGLGASMVGHQLESGARGIPVMSFPWLLLPGAVAGLVAWWLIYASDVRPPPAPPSAAPTP